MKFFNVQKIPLIPVNKETREFRQSICNSCEHYNSTLHICKKCGCVIDFKITIAYAKCPIDKWLSVRPD